jgi:hypothetical protein
MDRAQLEVEVIRSLDRDSTDAQDIHTLIAEALHVDQSITETLRQVDFLGGNSLIVLGRVDGQLATMNIFMKQRFTCAGGEIIAFQSGFSSTGNAYRGRGLWPKLLTSSESVLEEEGAQFIFGYPNPVSCPLFVNKLGYVSMPMIKAYILAAASSLYRSRKQSGYITPDLTQTEKWKRRVRGDALLYFRDGDQHGFGLRRRARGVDFLEIGAFDPGSGTMGSCLRKMCNAANVSVCTVETTAESQFLPALAYKRPSRPFIYKWIKPAFSGRPIDGFGGLADDF